MSARKPRPKYPTQPKPRPVVTVAEPGDLVAAVPYLVGFTPQRSVVVVSLRGERLRCGVVARADLPDVGRASDEMVSADTMSDDFQQLLTAQELVAQLVGAVLRDEPEEAVLLVYDDEPFTQLDLPHQDLVVAFSSAFAAAGVRVKESLYLTSDRFWSYRCKDPNCCPAQGRLVDQVLGSPVAATLVAHGRAPLPTRDDLRRQVRARGPLTSAATGYAASVELEQRKGLDLTACQDRTLQSFGLLVMRRLNPLLDDAHPGERNSQAPDGTWGATPVEAGAVLAGLADVHVRDAVALQWTSWLRALPAATGDAQPPQPTPDDPTHDGFLDAPLDSVAAHIAAAQFIEEECRATGFAEADAQLHDRVVADVLLDLATLADGQLAVPALVLLAMQAWAAGEGALANVAVERSLRLDPDYRMAHLVDQLLCRGIAPRWVREQQAAERH